MKSLDPKLLALLIAVIILAALYTFTNTDKKYTTLDFWRTATAQDVAGIPQEALLPGNHNGPVLMWAAMANTDPDVIAALVKRGVDVNESDTSPLLSATPLSAAASRNKNPAIIDELIRSGATIDKVVGTNDKTPLIIAAELNHNPEIIKTLIRHGASTTYKDKTGRNALEAAIHFQNTPAEKILREHTK